MKRLCAVILGATIAVLLIRPGTTGAQNVVPNPGFEGTGGLLLPINGGVVNAVDGVPDSWRAFAVNSTSSIDLDIVPLAADEIFAGSPATNAVLLRLNGVGADQGFDDDIGRFPILVGLDHHLELYVKSANADASSQVFNVGFPLFDASHAYLFMEPGGSANNTATSDWTLFVGPTFLPADPVSEGHISFRCVQDGGEDAILIALPSVTSEGVQVFPTNLVCAKDIDDVTLSWQNHAAYDSLKILRDAAEIASLAADATTYTDSGVPVGAHTYQVLATQGASSDGPTCDVTVFTPPAAGASASTDLGDIDIEMGLMNSFREGFSDGETTFVICGPEGDLREARSNWGADDPTPDAADPFFYFTVTDSPLKEQRVFRLEAEVYDDPAHVGIGLSLEYTNRDSTGPLDLANTFFPASGKPLGGSGDWIIVGWDIENAGFRSFQQGVADFRIGVTGGARVCTDRVTLTYFPRPSGLRCRRVDDGIQLSWENNAVYAAIRVLRDGSQIAQIPGDSTSYLDASVPEGDHLYEVLVVLGGAEGGPSCSIAYVVVPPGTSVSVELGDIDVEDGLTNSVRGSPGDGENDFQICGPAGDPREGRSNLGADDPDPPPDSPDALFYFTVTDAAMKAQASLRILATVYNAPGQAGTLLYLQYTTQDSTGPADIPDTFYPLENPPMNPLGGTDTWIVLEWEITNAGFRSFQQGQADFRLGVIPAVPALALSAGERVCIDRVEVVFDGDTTVPVFHRGDSDGDGRLNITDPIFSLSYLFTGGPAPGCLDAADDDDDGRVNITDPIHLLTFLFQGGPAPAPPGPATQPCGPDVGADALAECVYAGCGV